MAEEENPLPLSIQYTNLLHKHRDPDAPEVKAFVEKHREDAVFVQRVKTLNKVFRLKKRLTE